MNKKQFIEKLQDEDLMNSILESYKQGFMCCASLIESSGNIFLYKSVVRSLPKDSELIEIYKKSINEKNS